MHMRLCARSHAVNRGSGNPLSDTQICAQAYTFLLAGWVRTCATCNSVGVGGVCLFCVPLPWC